MSQTDHGSNGQTITDRPAPARRLGRGLNALLGSGAREETHAPAADPEPADRGEIHVELIERNPFQPRTDFDDSALEELCESIRRRGILQPLLVRPMNGQYQLIAGERRLLAAKKAGLENVPCRVLELEDREVCEAAIEENLKRKDLHALEKAQAFRDYLKRFGGTVEELARSLSVSRPAVSNLMRLLDLEPPVRDALRADRITAGHARALLMLDGEDQVAAMAEVETLGLTVRAAEKHCRDLAHERDVKRAAAEAAAGSADGTGPIGDVFVDDTVPDADEAAADEAATNGPAADGPAAEQAGEAADGGETPATLPFTPGTDPVAAEQGEPAETDADAPATIPMADGGPPSEAGAADDKPGLTPHLLSVCEQLRSHLGTTVDINLRGRESGQIRITFGSNDEFERVVKRLRAA